MSRQAGTLKIVSLKHASVLMHNINVSVNSTISVLTFMSTGPNEIFHNVIQKPALRKGIKGHSFTIKI